MGGSIIIALGNAEFAHSVEKVLIRYGFTVSAVCTTAAGALLEISQTDSGVVITEGFMPDMHCSEFAEYLPKYFEMLLLEKAGHVGELGNGRMVLQRPVKVADLVNTVSMMLTQLERQKKRDKKKPAPRSWKEKNYIDNAKMLLMERHQMSEEEAFRYIQKSSMDSGTNMAETAQMILMLMIE